MAEKHEKHQSEKSGMSPNALLTIMSVMGIILVVAAFFVGFLAGKLSVVSDTTGGSVPTVPTQPTAPTAGAPVNVALGNNVKGNAKAPVTIVEFSDFQCPFCKRFYQDTLDQIMTNYVDTGKVKFSYRHFPLGFHANAGIAAEASECARAQGKFWEYHDILFTKGNGDGSGLDAASLKQHAADLKLDTAKFNTCLDTGAMKSAVQKDFDEGRAAGVQGTPAFFVNGKLISGAQPFSVFQQAIDAELAK